jgi:hypothetical protein
MDSRVTPKAVPLSNGGAAAYGPDSKEAVQPYVRKWKAKVAKEALAEIRSGRVIVAADTQPIRSQGTTREQRSTRTTRSSASRDGPSDEPPEPDDIAVVLPLRRAA